MKEISWRNIPNVINISKIAPQKTVSLLNAKFAGYTKGMRI
jgi:hypothetical protein